MSSLDTSGLFAGAAAVGASVKAPQSSVDAGAAGAAGAAAAAVAGGAEANASQPSATAEAGAAAGAGAAGAAAGAPAKSAQPSPPLALGAAGAATGADEKSAHASAAVLATTGAAAGAAGVARSRRSNIPPPAAGAAGAIGAAGAAGAAGAEAFMTGVAVVFPLASPGVGPETFRSTYCLCSYLLRMYRSTTFISDDLGFAPGWRFFSQYSFARTLPMRSMKATCSSVHLSSCVDRTREMCTPRPRWIPEQLVHMNTPKLVLAQRGRRIGQSTHTRFSGRLRQRFRRLMSAFCTRSSILLAFGNGIRRAKVSQIRRFEAPEGGDLGAMSRLKRGERRARRSAEDGVALWTVKPRGARVKLSLTSSIKARFRSVGTRAWVNSPRFPTGST